MKPDLLNGVKSKTEIEPAGKNGRKIKTSQLRIRLSTEERQALEIRCAQNRAAGHSYADTLSSWLRYHIGMIVASETRVICCLSKERHRELMELANVMDQSPEKIMEVCLAGIVGLIAHPSRKSPLIVAEFRLRKSYGNSE